MATVLDCDSGNQSIVKFEMQLKMVAWWLWRPTTTTEALVDSRRGKIHSLIAMKLACRNDGAGGSWVSWLLQNGGSWGCGNGGAGVCWQNVEDGLWFFRNARVLEVGNLEAEWATMGTFCWEPMGGGEAETESLILQGEGRGRDRKPDFVACF